MDCTNFNYKYNGKNEFLKYFSENPCSKWSFTEFKNNLTHKNEKQPDKNKLLATYRNCLNTISEHKKTPENVKKHIKMLLNNDEKDVNQTTSTSTSINNITTGNNSVYINLQNNIITDNQIQHTSEIEEDIEENHSQNKRCFKDILKEKIMIRMPNENDRLIINGFDFSLAFYKFQKKLLDFENKIQLEPNVHYIFASSSILLVKKNRMHKELIKSFEGNFIHLNKYLENLFEINKYSLPMDTIIKVSSIIQDIQRNINTRNQGMIKLLTLAENVPANQFKVLQATTNLLRKVLRENIEEDIKEQELSTRYVDAFLSGLFDDPDNGILLRLNGLVTIESRKNVQLSNKRPDITASILNGLEFGTSVAYGEIKCDAEFDNNFLVCKDLVRLGLFAKNSIDENDMKGVMAFQIVGRNIVFYIMSLLNDGVYIMYELNEVAMPMTIEDLLKFSMDYGKLLNILNVYDNWCITDSSSNNNNRRIRSTMDEDGFNLLIDPTINRKRPCVTKHRRHQ